GAVPPPSRAPQLSAAHRGPRRGGRALATHPLAGRRPERGGPRRLPVRRRPLLRPRIPLRGGRASPPGAGALARALAARGRGRHRLPRFLGGPRGPAARREAHGERGDPPHRARGPRAAIGPRPPPTLRRDPQRPDLRAAARRDRRGAGRTTSLTLSGRSGRIGAVSLTPSLSTKEV